MNSLTVTIAPPPTSTNSGQNRRWGNREERQRQDRAAREHGFFAATKALDGAPPPRWKGDIQATIVWTSRTKAWPDAWNMTGMLKCHCDGFAKRLGFDDRQINRIDFVFATDRENPRVDIILEVMG
jgi:hypothetical protein